MSSPTTLIRNFTFGPIVTGSLWYLLTRGPEQYRHQLLDHLERYVSVSNIARGITALKWLFILGLIRNAHVFLSDLAQNSWRFRSERHRYDWPNEIAVVTGGAGGFGALISTGLAAHGIKVISVDVVEALSDDLAKNPKIFYYRCDLRDRQAVLDLRDTIAREHGDPSILINNAGVCWQHRVLNASEEALRRLFDVNVIAQYFTLQAFLPAMIKKRKGHVVTMASVASFLTPPGLVAYCNTKAAVLSLHEGIKAETHQFHRAPEVNFTVVHPVYAATPMIQTIRNELDDAGWAVIDPKVVGDAVVNQVLACRSNQIVLAAGQEFLSTLRSWPHWLVGALMATVKPVALAREGKEAQLS